MNNFLNGNNLILRTSRLALCLCFTFLVALLLSFIVSSEHGLTKKTDIANADAWKIAYTSAVYAEDSQEPEKVTIRFVMNGHGEAIDPIEINKGGYYPYPSEASSPTDPSGNWHFLEWFQDSALTDRYTSEDKREKIEEDLTLYAAWVEAPEITYIHEYTLLGTSTTCKGVKTYYYGKENGRHEVVKYSSKAENDANAAAWKNGLEADFNSWFSKLNRSGFSEKERQADDPYYRVFAREPVEWNGITYSTGEYVDTISSTDTENFPSDKYLWLSTRKLTYSYTYSATLKHSWSEITIKKKATDRETGLATRKCTICGTENEIVIPKITVKENAASTGVENKTNPGHPSAKQADKVKVTKSIKKIAASKMTTAASSKKGTMRIKFKKVKGASNYRVQYRKAGTKKWKSYWTGGELSYTIKGLKRGQLFQFRVAGYGQDSDGNWQRGAWSAVSYRYFVGVKSKTTAKSGAIIVKLNKYKGASGYQVLYSPNKNMKGRKIVTSKKTRVKLTNIQSNKFYYIQTRPYKYYKGKKYLGILYTINT